MNLYLKETPQSPKSFITSNAFLDDSIAFQVELMNLPRISFTLPIEELDIDIKDSSFEIILEFDNGYIFQGKVIRKEYDLAKGTIRMDVEHIGHELEHQRVPTNYAVNELTLGEIYNYDTYVRPELLGDGGSIYKKEKKSKEEKKAEKEAEKAEKKAEREAKKAAKKAEREAKKAAKVTKTGEVESHSEVDENGNKVRIRNYKMSDGSVRQVKATTRKEVYDKHSYKTVTTTEYPSGLITEKTTVKKGKGIDPESTTRVIRESFKEEKSETKKEDKTESKKEDKKEDDDEIITYIDKSELNGLFNDTDWNYKFTDNSDDVVVTYLFSNQDKLQALTDICKQTEDVFWRVSLTEERTIEIGRFGDYKELAITKNNIIDGTLNYVEDFQDICNYAIYFTDKSDSGTTALTLRDVYNHPELQNENFPVIQTGEEINTERRYDYLDLIPFGANNKGDYAVLDKEGIALEAGNIFEKAFTSNDIQTVAKDTNKELTDEDRLIASRQLYTQAIRKLIHSRRKVGITVSIDDLEPNTNVGDKVRFMLMSEIFKVVKCSGYYKKLLTVNDYFYISEIEMVVHTAGAITYNLTIEKHIYNNSEV